MDKGVHHAAILSFGSILYFPLVALMAGCGALSAEHPSRQSDIGLGIVEGTKGYRQIQQELFAPHGMMKIVQGQVRHIEGAAYIVHRNNHDEVRLPIDEQTRIDRPAHVGDWIEAHIDQSGRASLIHNIDDSIILE